MFGKTFPMRNLSGLLSLAFGAINRPHACWPLMTKRAECFISGVPAVRENFALRIPHNRYPSHMIRGRFIFLLLLIGYSCRPATEPEESRILLETTASYRVADTVATLPYKIRYTYFSAKDQPHRWIEVDSAGGLLLDYIYEYDETGRAVSARAKEKGEDDYAMERFRYEGDSLKTTEWLDSTGQVYYKMVDYLDEEGRSYRASFGLGNKVQGYDTTYYTPEGFLQKKFFTNRRGEVFNDQTFTYPEINAQGAWVKRKKYVGDSLVEVKIKNLNYEAYAVDGTFYPGLLSKKPGSESSPSVTRDQQLLFFTRTQTWDQQTPYLSRQVAGIFEEPSQLKALGQIYNGAISPSGQQIIYCVQTDTLPNIWLTKKKGDTWEKGLNLSAVSGIYGGYFHWIDEEQLLFYTLDHQGDLRKGRIRDNRLEITDSLATLNTTAATEFSPFLSRDETYLIFTRYEEKNPDQQGFFISRNPSGKNGWQWTTPEKIPELEYGWGACVLEESEQFLYTDGDDLKVVPLEKILIPRE